MKTLLQFIGILLVVVGGQGLVRLFLDQSDSGFAVILPGGYDVYLGAYIVVVALGFVLAVLANKKA